MKLQITGHNIELTDALRDTVKAKALSSPQSSLTKLITSKYPSKVEKMKS